MNLEFLAPYTLEILLSALIVVMITFDTTLKVEEKSTLYGIGSIGLLLILGVSCFLHTGSAAPADTWVLDDFALYFKRLFLLAALFGIAAVRAFAVRFRHGEGEYYSLTLFATLGGLIMASAQDWITIFVGLELMTITLFIMVSWSRRDGKSLEAGMKYVIAGTFSSAFLLYGIAYVYGYTGTVRLGQVAQYLEYNASALPSGMLFGLLLVFTGIAFKMAAFPFHVWAPDVYEGAPTPTTAVLGVASKSAGFLLGLRILVEMAEPIRSGLTVKGYPAVTLLAIVSAITITYGSLASIPQWNIKRLMGYSSIGHAGYLLIGIAAGGVMGTTAILYYLLAYLFTNFGLFMALCCMDRYSNDYEIESLAGLGRRAPLLGITITFALLSLAGIPPFGGFFGKLMLIMTAFDSQLYWLAVLGMVMVVPSMYVYLNVLKYIYAVEPRDREPIEVDGWSALACAAACAGMVITGLFQGPFLKAAGAAAKSLG